MKQKLTFWLPIFFGCHQRDDRSFHYHGKKFPICARCTGELVGIIGTMLFCWLWMPTVLWAVIIMVPMVIDGFTQKLTKYESNNIKRFLTGSLFGYGLTTLFVRSTLFAFHYGQSLGLKFFG